MLYISTTNDTCMYIYNACACTRNFLYTHAHDNLYKFSWNKIIFVLCYTFTLCKQFRICCLTFTVSFNNMHSNLPKSLVSIAKRQTFSRGINEQDIKSTLMPVEVPA